VLENYQDYIEAAGKTGSLKDIHALCSDMCNHYGFDHFVYGARFPTSLVNPRIVFISGYPTQWWERYKSENYMRIDPLVAHCEHNITPIRWDCIQRDVLESPNISRFMSEAVDSGLRNGLSIPVHTSNGEFAMLNFSTSDSPEKSSDHIIQGTPEVYLLSNYIHEAVTRVVDALGKDEPPVKLTNGERECLLWAADGKTAWETAQILKVSERTIVWHIQNAQSKLKTVSRQQTVARAISRGIISPQL